MASNTIKGLTVEIGGDTKKLSKAIKDVEAKSRSLSKELGDINKLLKMDPGNMDLLAQKQEVLAQAAEAAAKKLDTLKEAERQVQQQFERGEVSEEQLRALQREIVATENKMKGYQKAAQQTAQEMEQLGDGAGQAGKELGETGDEAKKAGKNVDNFADAADKAEDASGGLGTTLANVAKTGFAAVAAACAAAIAGLVAAAESTREYRTEMGKLDAAFSAAGKSSEVATAAYKSLYGVIGETDQSVEAAQQIALLAKSEEDVAKWADLAAGVVGRFGDALQPETFYEAANETLKLNEATGAYVQLLEGTGYSVDEFNAGLQACNTEAERQAYMLSITQQLLGAAGESYKETNAEVIRANQANDAWVQSLAGVGGAIEPILTDIKLMGASLLSEAVPGVQALAEAFRGMMNGEEGAAGDFVAAVSGMVSGLVGKITEALPGIAQVGLSIVTTLATSLAQQLPKLLTTGGQIVFQLLNGIATNLPSIAQGALNAIDGFVQGLQTNLPLVLAKGREILMNLATGIKENLPSLVSHGLDIIMNFAQTIYDNAPSLIQTGFDVLSNLVAGIMSSLPTLIAKVPEIISTFANTINHNFPTILKKGAELVLQIVKGLLSAIPTLIANIPKIISAIVDVWQAFNWLQLGKNVITFLKNGITSMLGAIKAAGTNVHNAVVNAIKSLPSKLLQLGKNALEFLKNAINGARGAVASAGGNILNAVVNAIKSMPSKLLSMGKDAISKLGSAIGSGASTIKSKAVSIVNSVIDSFKSLPGKMVDIGKDIINGVISGISAMVGKLYDSIKNALSGLVEKGKKALGIKSPSRVMAKEIGQHIPTGAAMGIDQNTKAAEHSMVDMADEMVAAANAELAGASLTAPGFNGLTFERNLQHRPAAAQTGAAPYMGIGDKLDAILAAIEKGQILTIDKKLLVGGTANDYDNTLGQRRALVARGAL